jgi:hypothetical protein
MIWLNPVAILLIFLDIQGVVAGRISDLKLTYVSASIRTL